MWCHRRMTPRWPDRGSSDGSDSDSETRFPRPRPHLLPHLLPLTPTPLLTLRTLPRSLGTPRVASSALTRARAAALARRPDPPASARGPACPPRSDLAEPPESCRGKMKLRPPSGRIPRWSPRFSSSRTPLTPLTPFDFPFDSSDALTLLRLPPAHIFATNSPLFSVARSARNWRSDAYVSGGKFRGCEPKHTSSV